MKKHTEIETLLDLLLSGGRHSPKSKSLARKILTQPGEGLSEKEIERAYFSAMESAPKAFLDSIEGADETTRLKLRSAFRIAQLYAMHRENSRRPHGPDGVLLSAEDPALVWSKVSDDYRSATHEWFGFVPMYRSGRLGSFCVIEHGSRTHVNLDPLEIFSRILAVRPEGFYLLHNHPSGELTPSETDYLLTERIRKMSDTLGLKLYDHGIVSALGECWISEVRSSHESHSRQRTHLYPVPKEPSPRSDSSAPPGAG